MLSKIVRVMMMIGPIIMMMQWRRHFFFCLSAQRSVMAIIPLPNYVKKKKLKSEKNVSSRPLRRPLRIIKSLLRTITTCQKLNKMPPRNSQDVVKKIQHIAAYSYKYFKAGLELEFSFLQEQPLKK